jgi:hypothetical protein
MFESDKEKRQKERGIKTQNESLHAEFKRAFCIN